MEYQTCSHQEIVSVVNTNEKSRSGGFDTHISKLANLISWLGRMPAAMGFGNHLRPDALKGDRLAKIRSTIGAGNTH
ncbi:MAG: hypothetical protein V3R30_15230, partial [Kiloniellales bacterium]